MRHWSVGLALGLALAAAAPAYAQAVRIGTEPGAELMAILFKLAGGAGFDQGRYQEYNRAIERHFGPFRDHEAVALARTLREEHGTGHSAAMSLAAHLGDPPALRERVAWDSLPSSRLPADPTRRFVEAARRFAAESDADRFFRDHQAVYDSADTRVRRAVEDAGAFAWLERFFGIPLDRDFVVVPLLANSGGNYATCVQPPGARRECWSVLGHEQTDAAGFPAYDARALVELLVHELSHPYLDGPVAAVVPALERSGSAARVHEAVAEALRWQAYGRWESTVDETLVQAAVGRYLAQRDPALLEEYYRERRARSWLWVEEVAELLAEYEADRARYPTLDAFLPRVIAYFDALPERLPEMQRRYDALRPRVVSLSIPEGAEVDAAVGELVVRFDRPVSDDGWSLLPVLPGGEERFPKVTDRALDADGMGIRIGLALEPGREYELQLNTPHGHGFRSIADGAPLTPQRLRFRTRPAEPAP